MAGGRRDPVDMLSLLDGRATWRQLRGSCTQHALRTALVAGRIERARRGLYVLPDLPDPQAAAARCGGVLSHLSAATASGLAVLVDPQRIHVTVPANSRPAAEKLGTRHLVVHRRDLLAAHLRATTTSPLRTVIDCATTLPFAQALAVADSALREGLVRRQALLDAAVERRGPGRRALLRVARHADGDAANPFESALRAAVIEAGVTGFTPQLWIELPRYRPIRVDLADPVRMIALEADSFAHHGTRQALREDCLRYNHLVRAGWLVLRFAWEHVMRHPAEVAATVLETCERRRRAVVSGAAG